MPDTIARLNEALAGRHLIERELGEGGMATVYLADHEPPRTLFRTDAAAGFSYPRYDVSPDDQRFLMVGRGDFGVSPSLVRIESLLEALKPGS